MCRPSRQQQPNRPFTHTQTHSYAARGWASVLQGNPRVRAELSRFVARPDSWTLGLCNGCQLLAALGVVPWLEEAEAEGGGPPSPPSVVGVALAENESGRFESRFVTVGVEGGSPAVLLEGMEGAVLGVWSAHGEGRFVFRDAEVSLVGGGYVCSPTPPWCPAANPHKMHATPNNNNADTGPRPRRTPRPNPLRRPRPPRPHGGISSQPQRLPGGHRGAVLPLWAALGHHAPPGAVLAGVAGMSIHV